MHTKTLFRRAVFFLPHVLMLAGLLWVSVARGQDRPIHYFQSANQPPGSIGQAQLLRGGPLPGYLQPVKVIPPAGAHLSVAMDGHFPPSEAGPLTAGLLIGQVYTYQVTRIPGHEGAELYPTVEVLNRLYPPEDQALRFPIPVELTEEELELALRGLFVLRVIYLEDAAQALPLQQQADHPPVADVAAEDDPLLAADRLGRPMAILRMGSRIPDTDPRRAFPYGTPPLQRYAPEELATPVPAAVAPEAIIRERQSVPRLPLPAPQNQVPYLPGPRS